MAGEESNIQLINYKVNEKNNLSQRKEGLDVLRAVAILLVMFTHLRLQPKDEVTGIFKYIRLLLVWGPRGGWIGVDLFFVLSGFLVSGLLFIEYKKKSTIDAGRFLIRRGFKIYPNFIFFILLSFIVERIFLNINVPAILYIKDLFFIHNYAGGRFGHTWSLDVEEFFYFFLTAYFIFIIKIGKLNLKTLIITDVLLIVLSVSGRWINNIIYPVLSFRYHYEQTHLRLDSLFFGVILAYLYQYKREELCEFTNKWKNRLFTPLLSLLIIPFVVDRGVHHWISIIFLSVMPFCFGAVIILALQSSNKFFKNKFLSYIGKYSYGIYLWHFPWQEWLLPKDIINFNKWIVYAFSYFILSIITGIASTKLIEIPFLKLREKFYPSRTARIV